MKPIILTKLFLFLTLAAFSQLTLTNSNTEITLDFDIEVTGAIAENWDGTGIQSTVSPGDLDSDFTRLENLGTATTYGSTTGIGSAVTGGVNNNDDPPAKIYCAAYPALNKCMRIKPGEGNNAISGPFAKAHGEAIWEFRVEWDYNATIDPELTIEVSSSFHNDNTDTDIQPMDVSWQYRIGTSGNWSVMSTAISSFTNNTVGEMDDYDFFHTIDMDGVSLGTDVYFRAVVADQTGGNFSVIRDPKADSYFICQVDLSAQAGPLPAEDIDFHPSQICFRSSQPAGPLNTYELTFDLDTYGEINVEDYFLEYSPNGIYWFDCTGSVAGSGCMSPCDETYLNQTVTFLDTTSSGIGFSRYFRVYSEDIDGYIKYYLDDIEQETYSESTNCFHAGGGNESFGGVESPDPNEAALRKSGDQWVLAERFTNPVRVSISNALGQQLNDVILSAGQPIPIPQAPAQIYFVSIREGGENIITTIFK